MPRSTIIKLIVIVAVVAALVVGFSMMKGSKASLAKPAAASDS